MTRINSAISVQNLTDEHLLAEHREIKRLPYCLGKAIQSGSINNIPPKFTLGRGHVTFFLDKQGFCRDRYFDIYKELKRRNFDILNFSGNWDDLVGSKYWNYYHPTLEEKELLIERITTRLLESPKKCWHYYGKEMTKEEAIELLKTERGTV